MRHIDKRNGTKPKPKPFRPIKVLIGVPCQDMVHASWAYHLVNLQRETSIRRPDIDLILQIHKGTLIASQRNYLANEALRLGCTHLLFMDADMAFPKEALLRLLGWDVPIVAANYVTRRSPIVPVAMHGERRIYSLNPSDPTKPLEAVHHVGMGLMLINTQIFEQLPKPWFFIPYSEGLDVYAGEDVWFCDHVRHTVKWTDKNGFERSTMVLVDHELSREVEHMGQINHRHEHGEEYRGDPIDPMWDEEEAGSAITMVDEAIERRAVASEGRESLSLHERVARLFRRGSQ